MTKFVPSDRFSDAGFRIVSLAEMSAELYLGSDRLDLDQLSRSRSSETNVR